MLFRSQVSVDIVFEQAEPAVAAHTALEARIVEEGWQPGTARIQSKKWTVDAYDSPKGHLELGCCPARADRRHLILVSWWPPGQ